MIAASGRDVEIVYTGLRPGEKITEELFDDDDTDCGRRAHAQITAVITPLMKIDELGDLLHGRSAIGVRTRLRELCQRQPLPSVAEAVRVDEDVVDHVVGL
jgi:FlaA1/EpsC-like NDP-sugar epimerase